MGRRLAEREDEQSGEASGSLREAHREAGGRVAQTAMARIPRSESRLQAVLSLPEAAAAAQRPPKGGTPNEELRDARFGQHAQELRNEEWWLASRPPPRRQDAAAGI